MISCFLHQVCFFKKMAKQRYCLPYIGKAKKSCTIFLALTFDGNLLCAIFGLLVVLGSQLHTWDCAVSFVCLWWSVVVSLPSSRTTRCSRLNLLFKSVVVAVTFVYVGTACFPRSQRCLL